MTELRLTHTGLAAEYKDIVIGGWTAGLDRLGTLVEGATFTSPSLARPSTATTGGSPHNRRAPTATLRSIPQIVSSNERATCSGARVTLEV